MRFAVVFLALGSLCHAAITHGTGNTNSVATNTTFNVVLGAAPTTGQAVTCGIQTDVAVTAMAVKDSNNNSYTISSGSPSTVNTNGQIWLAYLLSAPANATATITFSWTTSTNAVAYCDPFTVTGGTLSFDVDAKGTGTTGTAINTPAITPTNTGELLYGCTAASNTITAPTAGATAGVWTGVSGAINGGDMCEYVLNSTNSATAANFTHGACSSQCWTGMITALKFTASGSTFVANPTVIIVGP